MLQGDRMVLIRREQVGHGRVPGVACLGEEAQVGQLIFFHHPFAHKAFRTGCRLAVTGVQPRQAKHDQVKKGEKQETVDLRMRFHQP